MALRSTAAGRAQYMAFQAAGGHLIHEPEPAPAPSPRLSELLLAGPEEVRNLAIAAGIWSMPTVSPAASRVSDDQEMQLWTLAPRGIAWLARPQ